MCAGKPEPDVDWYKDNRMMAEGGRFKFMFDDEGLCSLVIKETNTSDRGRYKCVASNAAGKAQCSAELFVESKLSVSPLQNECTCVPDSMVQTLILASTVASRLALTFVSQGPGSRGGGDTCPPPQYFRIIKN